jgi:hypothetical protein
MWAIYLLAQSTATGGILGIQAMNTMQAEAVDIRNVHSWSIPNQAAFDYLAGYVVEYWSI